MISRRTFVRGAAAGIASLAVARNSYGANAKLNHACIGVGGMMGGGDFDQFKSHPGLQIVAICDVDKNILARVAARVPGARTYSDWREMFDKEGDRIDSVNVTVPDHMHAAITMTALHAKKHVYCQKPLTHDVSESRKIAQAAEAAGVVTQLGTQLASGVGDRTAVQWLRQGVIGKFKRVILCSNRPGAETYRLAGPRPARGVPPPAELAWDLWLGTAPERPFAPDLYHPSKWRAWQDFGTGWSGDIGCHVFDPVWKGLGLTAPLSIVAEVQKSWQDSPERRADTWPQGNHITWVFPGGDNFDGREITLEWFDGEFFPPEEILKMSEGRKYPFESSLVIGTEGAVLMQSGEKPRLLPSERFKDVAPPNLPARNHYRHFVDACLGGEKTESHFQQTGPMAEAILLGTVAVRMPGTLLKWDPAGLKIADEPGAERLLSRTYRKGWEVRGL